MPERNQKVQDRVREELSRNPGAGTKELQEIAASVDASVGELSLRQFNAGYVLPVKRSSGGGRKSKGSAPAKGRGKRQAAAPAQRAQPRQRSRQSAAPSDDRERVRATLLEFARDFSEADSRAGIVAVLSELDRYVDRIVGTRR